MIFDREPVVVMNAITTAIRAIALALMGFDVIHVTEAQLAGVMIAIEAIFAVFGTMIVRNKVFAPVNKGGDQLEAVKYEGRPVEPVK